MLLSLSLWVNDFIYDRGEGGMGNPKENFRNTRQKIFRIYCLDGSNEIFSNFIFHGLLRSWVCEYVRDVHFWLCFLLVLQRPARQVQGCEVPGGQRGRCVNMEDCVLRDIHLDYVKNKGYFCLLRNQRLVLTLSVIISVVNLQFQLYQIRIFEGWLSWWVTLWTWVAELSVSLRMSKYCSPCLDINIVKQDKENHFQLLDMVTDLAGVNNGYIQTLIFKTK